MAEVDAPSTLDARDERVLEIALGEEIDENAKLCGGVVGVDGERIESEASICEERPELGGGNKCWRIVSMATHLVVFSDSWPGQEWPPNVSATRPAHMSRSPISVKQSTLFNRSKNLRAYLCRGQDSVFSLLAMLRKASPFRAMSVQFVDTRRDPWKTHLVQSTGSHSQLPSSSVVPMVARWLSIMVSGPSLAYDKDPCFTKNIFGNCGTSPV